MSAVFHSRYKSRDLCSGRSTGPKVSDRTVGEPTLSWVQTKICRMQKICAALNTVIYTTHMWKEAASRATGGTVLTIAWLRQWVTV